MSDAAQRLAPALVLLAGAAVYALAVGTDAVTFDATPLIVGLAAVAAGAVRRRARLVAVGLPLVGWGAAVVLVRHGPVPDEREAAAFLVGAGLGLVAASWWCRRSAIPVTGAAVALTVGGLSFYLAFDVDALDRWWWWTAALVVWAGVEAARARQDPTVR